MEKDFSSFFQLWFLAFIHELSHPENYVKEDGLRAEERELPKTKVDETNESERARERESERARERESERVRERERERALVRGSHAEKRPREIGSSGEQKTKSQAHLSKCPFVFRSNSFSFMILNDCQYL